MRTCDILAPRLSARHKFYFCVKDAEKTCNYVILSVLGIFYKLFCTSMTTSIIIGFYYYISPGCYIERTQFIFRIQGKKISHSFQWEVVEDPKNVTKEFENLGCLVFRGSQLQGCLFSLFCLLLKFGFSFQYLVLFGEISFFLMVYKLE